MSKSLDYATAGPIFDTILAIDLDNVKIVSKDRLYQKEFAKQVRAFLKNYGINSRQVSVTCATGSMCYWIDIRIPHVDRGFSYNDISRMGEKQAQEYFERGQMIEDHRVKARTHLDAVIAKAFPGCTDRSDCMTDYYDFMYTCW